MKNNFQVGKIYRYSEIPEFPNENNNLTEVNDFGKEYIGSNAIHLRYKNDKSITDVWFIYHGQVNEGLFQCVYNN